MVTYHSKLKGSKVYHNDPNCTRGNNIEEENYTTGDGGRKLCDICRDSKKKPNKKKK